MANSLMQIVSDGSLSTIPLTIKFFDQSHIKVFVNNAELPDGAYTFAWSGATTITITPAVVLGAEVSIRRKTPAKEVLHDFQAGAVFSEVSVDENFRQELFLLQEASEQSFVTDLYDDLDMHGNKVRNLGTAVLPGDAVSLSQATAIAEGGGAFTLRAELAAPAGSALVGFQQSGAGSVPRASQDKMREIQSAADRGAVGNGVADDTAALINAATYKLVDLGSGNYKVDSVSLALGAKSAGATITMSGRKNNVLSPLFSGQLIGDLTILGDAPVALNVISATIFSASTFSVEYYAGDFRNAKYQLVDIVLSGAVQIGNMLLVKADQPELSGCFEVVDVPSANTARVLMLAQGNLNVAAFTGTAKVLTTVIQFSNITAIDVSGGLLTLTNVGILGACYPVVNGSRSNVYNPAGGSGVPGIVARNGGLILGINCGVSGMSGTQLNGVDGGEIDWTGSFVSCGGRNGISASFGKFAFGGGVSSQNLLDNVITQDQSFGFATSSISAHAGRHGYISASNATANASNGNTQQNGFLDPTNGDGASASSANLTVIGLVSKNNANCGIRGIGNSDIRGTGINVSGNSDGVKVDTASHALITGTVNGNTGTDLLAVNGGKIEAIGATYSTVSPVANRMGGTGAIVQTTSTIPDISTSGGLEVAGGGVVKRVVRARVTSVNFPSIAPGSQQSISVTVPGVLVADHSVAVVQRDAAVDRAGLMCEALVSADDTVTITCNNFSTIPVDPPPENFNLIVFQF